MSTEEQDLVIGRLVREYTGDRQQFIAFTAKLKRIGESLRQVGEKLAALDHNSYESIRVDTAQGLLQTIRGEVEINALIQEVHQYGELIRKMADTQRTIQKYGIEN